jgi:ATP-dependent RNA helicase DDX5/DBP2
MSTNKTSGAVDPWSSYRRSDTFELANVDDKQAIPKAYTGRRTRWARGEYQLEKIPWQGMELVPVKKDFWSYNQHFGVEERTQEQCERLRMEHSILIVDAGGLDVPKLVDSFHEAPFPTWAFDRFKRRGFRRPTGIQMQAWPIALQGHDLVGIAETGSGKTLSYIMPMLIHIEAQSERMPGEGPMGIILVPNRELCDQVQRQVNEFGCYAGVSCLCAYGGSTPEEQDKNDLSCQKGCDIIVATPGNLITLLEKRITNLRRATFMVLDEADELLSDGFEHQIRAIVSQVRPDRQMLLFSATWENDSLLQLAKDACSCKPIHVNVGSTKLAACKDINQVFLLTGTEEGVPQAYKGRSKLEVLVCSVKKAFAVADKSSKMLIFCNRVEAVPTVLAELQAEGIPCEGFSAEYTQAERQEALKQFRDIDNHLPVLVCTQLLGRGHDFQNLKYVVNFDMPRRASEYVHRIGRTGRAGEKGESLTLMEEMDLVGAREIRDCLEATGQFVPIWLSAACSNKKHQKYARMCRDFLNGTVTVPKALGDRHVPPEWKGRGGPRGLEMRNWWLRECGGEGAGRAPDVYKPELSGFVD